LELEKAEDETLQANLSVTIQIIQAAKQHAPKNKFARLSNEKPVMLNSVKETLQYQKHLCKKYINIRTSSSSRRK
jgi:hypothetical protein